MTDDPPFASIDPDRVADLAARIVAMLVAAKCTPAETLGAVACAMSIALDDCSSRERTHVAHMLADAIIAAGDAAISEHGHA